MDKITATSDIVKKLLEEVPATRSSDDYLYYKVCEYLNEGCMHISFGTVILNRKNFNLPPFESVRRSRQKLQSAYPEFAGTDEVEAKRIVNEAIVRDYARKVRV